MAILDNFGSQFINEASHLQNGIMSSYDKVKLDGIKLDDIQYINDGLNEINQYMVPQFIYGIKIDPSNPDPDKSVTYTDDAIGFVPLKVDQSTGVCTYGSWKNIIDSIFGIQPVLVKRDGTIISHLNPNNYNETIKGNPIDIESGDFGQVMIKFNHLYYKFSVDENKIWFQVSNKKNDNTWIETAYISEDGIGSVRKEFYVGAYECIQKNNILQSISNGLPSFKLAYDQINSASEFGVFHMMNITKKLFIIFLGYLVTKSINLEGNIGKGNISGPILKSGTMNTKGLFYGKSTNNTGVKLFGIENLWGNQLEYMNGLIQKLVYILNDEGTIPEQHLYFKEFYPYDKIQDFADLGKIEENRSGFISSIKFLTNSLYVPNELNGSSSTFFKSYYQNGKSKDATDLLHAVYSGNNTYGEKCGAEFLLLTNLNEDLIESTTHLIY